MSYLRQVELNEGTFAPFAAFRQKFGFVPNLFRAQSLRPDFIEAEAQLSDVVLGGGALSRVQKECIAVACSAAKLSTYCVTAHSEMLRAMGVSGPDVEQIAVDHHYADISEADKALLDFALKLTEKASRVQGEDIETLRRHGFTDEQILEAVVMTAYNAFVNTLSLGLGTVPDFAPKKVARPQT